jgi:Ca2+-binding RTX toxin-like protein
MAMVVWKALYQINTTDAGVPPDGNEQSGSSIAALDGDRIIVGWNDFANILGGGLGAPDSVAQRLDPLGAFEGVESNVSSVFFDGQQQALDLAALPGGGFVSAFQTEDQAFVLTDQNISYQIYDREMNLVSSRGNGGLPPAFTDAGVFQLGNETTPSVVGFADGSFMILYADDSAGNTDIRGFVVDSAGVEQPFFVVDNSAANATLPDAATLSNDGAAIVYESDTNAGDILFSVRTNAGGAVASGTVAGSASAESAPAVAALKGGLGGFVVAWADAAGDGAGNPGIKVRLYSNAGVAAGAGFAANLTVTAGAQSAPAVTGLLDGGFLVAWVDEPSGDIRGRRFDATGTAIETEFVMASLDTLSEPQLATLGDGRILLSATNTDGTGDKDIQAVIWDPRTSPINGTAGNDVLTTLPTASTVNGLGGNDAIYSGAGNDTLDGGGDADTIDWSFATGALNVTLNAAGGGSATAAGIGSDTFSNFENMSGGSAGDTLTGNASDNVLRGRGGNDTLNGASGTDTIDWSDATAGITAWLGANGNGTTTAAGIGTDTYSNFENMIGGSAGDLLTGNSLANVIDGRAGNDRLYGGGGADTLNGGLPNSLDVDLIDGGAGDDTVNGGGGADILRGGLGADTINGGEGGDNIRGGGDDDTINGDAGFDRYLAGEAGDDTVNGGAGNDRIDGGSENDTLNGDGGTDFITGGTGNDTIDGGDGDDGAGLGILRGEDGDDTISGGAGIDRLEGGNNNDRLIGGLGDDRLLGGADQDVFVFTLPSEGNDLVRDWTAADDQIEIDASAFGGGLAAGPLAANRLVVAAGAVANQAFGQFLYDTTTGQLSWDDDGTGGNAAVAICILLNGGAIVGTLATADFDIVA